MSNIEVPISDQALHYIGLDINDLGTVYDSILQTTLLADSHCLVICNPTPEDRDFKFMQLAKASGHTVLLVMEKKDAPKQTRWLGLSNPLPLTVGGVRTVQDIRYLPNADALEPVEAPLPSIAAPALTAEDSAGIERPRFSEDMLDNVAGVLMLAGIVCMAVGYGFTVKAIIWCAIPLHIGSVAVTFYGRMPTAMHCFAIFWLVLLSAFLALQIG